MAQVVEHLRDKPRVKKKKKKKVTFLPQRQSV
jgi:hypothetical protein